LSEHASLEKGFTILEVMISVAIMAVIGLALASVLNLVNSAQQDSKSQMGRDNLRGALLQIFQHPNLCKQALANTNFDSALAAATPGPGFPQPKGLPLTIDLSTNLLNHMYVISRVPPQGPGPTPSPVPLPNYNIAYQYLLLQSAIPLGADPNPNPGFAGNTLWQGVVVMTAFKLGGLTDLTSPILGGNVLPLQTVGTVVLSVTTADKIASCESVEIVNDACSNYGGISNPNPGPNQPQCIFKSPCLQNQIFAGSDPSGAPICQGVPTNCAPGAGLTVNPAGVLTCQSL
jgi:prepilin-type N-terminal cleavage/methylation domain-containing protein